MMPSLAHPGIVNLRGGLGTVVQEERDTGDSTRYGSLLLAASHRTPSMEFALEFPLRWDAETREFDSEIWDRKGDLLRPLDLLRYSTPSGRFTGGMEVLNSWTPGEGFLVRNLSGRGEIDYILPGVRFRWTGERLNLDAGMDRPVDPTVQAVGLKWKIGGGITLVLEGAVDPEAPLVFSGNSSDGRPRADQTERLTAQAAGFSFQLVEGNVLDLNIGAHTGDINGEAKATAGELTTTLDFTQSYVNRLRLTVRSISCEGGFVPAWFSDIYPVHRWGPGGQPFLALNPVGRAVPDKNMVSYHIDYDLGDFFSISGGLDRFEDDSMTRASFEAQLKEANGRGLEISVWSRADDPDVKLFSEDSNLYSRASALYNITPHILLNFSYERSWAFSDEDASFNPLNSILLGVIYDISL